MFLPVCVIGTFSAHKLTPYGGAKGVHTLIMFPWQRKAVSIVTYSLWNPFVPVELKSIFFDKQAGFWSCFVCEEVCRRKCSAWSRGKAGVGGLGSRKSFMTQVLSLPTLNQCCKMAFTAITISGDRECKTTFPFSSKYPFW